MSFYKFISFLLLVSMVLSCNDDPKTNAFGLSIKTNANNNTITLGETITISLINPKGISIQSVNFFLNGIPTEPKINFTKGKLGSQEIIASVISGNDTIEVKGEFKVLSDFEPEIYSYEIINTYPHDMTSYTQGLEFYNGELYESTGQYGESKLRKVDYKTGDVLKNHNLNNGYFAEGLTILNDKLYQLTWQENTGIVYDVNTFEKESLFRYGKSKEGWGLCNDGKILYKSDGTEQIWLLNTKNFNEDSKIEVYTNKGKIPRLNELEWVNGKIYANIYQKNGVVIINPSTGAVEKVIDFSPLKELVTQHPELDVLNGIAYNPDTQTLFVTGKNWDKLFEVSIKEK